jgi:hypothetical protein
MLTALVAFRFDRESIKPLWALPFQQLAYRQLMYMVLIQSVLSALTGARLRWHKLHRAGLTAPGDPIALPAPVSAAPGPGAVSLGYDPALGYDSPTYDPVFGYDPSPVADGGLGYDPELGYDAVPVGVPAVEPAVPFARPGYHLPEPGMAFEDGSYPITPPPAEVPRARASAAVPGQLARKAADHAPG